MTTRFRFRTLFATHKPRALRTARVRVRPSVETLEDRLTPSYTPFTELTGAANPLSGFSFGSKASPALGDVDGDGDLDVLVGEVDGLLRYFKNTGTATRPVYVQQTGAANPWGAFRVSQAAPALGDVDGDGDLDAVVGASSGWLPYFKNTGTATRPVYVRQTGAADPFNGLTAHLNSAPALGDVDGDGDLDVVAGASDGKLRYFKNTGTATRPVYVTQHGAANPFNGVDVGGYSAPALGDVDGDGDLDVPVGEGDGWLNYFKNSGTATGPVYIQQTGAANPVNGVHHGWVAAPALGDLAGDGARDALLGGRAGYLTSFLFLHRNGAVPPASSVIPQTGAANPFNGIDIGRNAAPALGDVDGDGDRDAVVGESEGLLKYFKNTGTATSPVYVPQTGAANPLNGVDVGIRAVPTLGDVDGDGDLDALVGELDGLLNYFKNTGTATSPVYVQQTGAANPWGGFDVGAYSAPALGDLDGDGDLDVVVGIGGAFNPSGQLLYFKNTGTATGPVYVHQNGTANPFNLVDVGIYSTPALGDMDGDGDLDVVVGEHSGNLNYFKNIGTATAPAYAQQLGSGNPFNGVDVGVTSVPALADIDGDGDPDASVGESDGILFYLRPNRPPVVDNAIPDQTFSGAGVHSYTVPANTFLELDHNPLTYSATLVGGGGLPAWLSFNPATRTFSGNPNAGAASPLQIRVSAADDQGASGFDDFRLTLVNVGDRTFVLTGFPSPSTAGQTDTFTLIARVDGNLATDYRGTVRFSSSDPQAVLPANYTFTVVDNGQRTFSATLRSAGSQSLTATDTVTATITGSQTGIVVNPSVVSTLAVFGFPSPTTAGVAGTFTVQARDVFGNVATGYRGTARFTSNDPQAILPANYTFTAVDNGVKTFSATLRTAGSQSLTATDTVITAWTGAQTNITVQPAATSTLAVFGLPSPITAGVADTFTVQARDPFGNAATGYRGTVRFTSSDPQATLPANYTFTAADNGMKTFSATLRTAGSQSLTATDTVTATLTGLQTGIMVTPAALTYFYLDPGTEPSPPLRQNEFLLVYLLPFDAYYNLIDTYSGLVTMYAPDPLAVYSASYTFTGTEGGVGYGYVAFGTTGTQEFYCWNEGQTVVGYAQYTVIPGDRAPGGAPQHGRGDATVAMALQSSEAAVWPRKAPLGTPVAGKVALPPERVDAFFATGSRTGVGAPPSASNDAQPVLDAAPDWLALLDHE